MAIQRSALAPRLRKRVGDVVYKRRLGQTIASQRPLTVHNPKTAKQVAQRAKFTIAIRMTQYAKYMLLIIFPKATYRGTKFNKFSKFLLKKIQDVAYPLTVLTYPNFNAGALGNGDGFNIIPSSVVAHAGKSVSIAWNPALYPSGAPTTGLVYAIGINMTRRQVMISQDSFAFTLGTGTFYTLSSPWTAGDNVFFALYQEYTDTALIKHTSQAVFQTVVAPVTILA